MKRTIVAALLILNLTIQSGSAGVLPTEVIAKKKAKILPTDDITIIGWVNGNAVPITSDGVSTSLVLTLAQPGLCDGLLNEWARGNRALISSAADLQYANAFLVKFSANGAPQTTIDPDAEEVRGDFRLFNRLQTAYRVRDNKVIDTPKVVRSKTIVGATPDPCLFSPIRAAGQAHAATNGFGGATTLKTGVFQINQGRIGELGQAVDRTLNDPGGTVGVTTPWIWSVVKFDTQGNLLYPFAVGSKSNPQIFPTYWVFSNGQLIPAKISPQSDLQTFIDRDQTSQIADKSEIP